MLNSRGLNLTFVTFISFARIVLQTTKPEGIILSDVYCGEFGIVRTDTLPLIGTAFL